MAQALERAEPDLVVSRMAKKLRKGKVFVDWSQNDQHKTTVAVYSLRARERPTASTPVEWEEVERRARARTIPTALAFEAGRGARAGRQARRPVRAGAGAEQELPAELLGALERLADARAGGWRQPRRGGGPAVV